MEDHDLTDALKEVEIVWESAPPKIERGRKRNRWELVLKEIKAAPGAEARILRVATREMADYRIRSIKARMREVDPNGKWSFSRHEMHDPEGGWGVWAVYRGQMTDTERYEADLRTLEWSRRIRLAHETRRIKKKLQAEVEELNRMALRPGVSIR